MYFIMQKGSLVLYKNKLSLILGLDDKIEIQTQELEKFRVRPKDLILLHEGPVDSLQQIINEEIEPVDLHEAIALIEGESISFKKLLEICFLNPTPAQAWRLYSLLGNYFKGDLDCLIPLDEEDREKRDHAARERAEKAARFQESVERLRKGTIQEEDRSLMMEVEQFALLKTERCRVLRELKVKETPEDAHRFLLETGFWPPHRDPWPERLGLSVESNFSIEKRLLTDTAQRRDLTHLNTWAVDDSGNQDPDDAFSWDGERLFIHIADPSETIHPDTELDLLARSRGATLYLPWTVVPMIGEEMVQHYALGLRNPSHALTLQVHIDPEGRPFLEDLFYSTIQVTRVSYEDFENRWSEDELSILEDKLLRYQKRRLDMGAVRIQLPEVKIRFQEGTVLLTPLENNTSRTLVAELMILAGELLSQWGLQQALPLIYAYQDSADELPKEEGLAGAWAIKKAMKKAGYAIHPKPHFGLGLQAYCQCTSPLRRAFDLINHQQIRARLMGQVPLTREKIQKRLFEIEPILQNTRKAEKLSRVHFTLLWHLQQQNWKGRGIVVERERNSATVLILDTAYDTKLAISDPPPLNTPLSLCFRSADLAFQRLVLAVDSSR